MTRLNKQEFQEWAYDDLLTNTTRGVLAEYIVATALGIDDEKRREWANHDLEFDDVGIEVKSAAYVQTWEQTRPSAITFSIRPAHGWDASSKTRADNAKRSAAVYVFCLLEGEDRTKIINPLELAQWTFYVLSTSELDRLVPTQKTIRLGRLKVLGARECKYDELKAATNEARRSIAATD
jgi:hypothetical protein